VEHHEREKSLKNLIGKSLRAMHHQGFSVEHHEREKSLKNLIWEEFACHAPYGIVAVLVSLTIISITSSFVSTNSIDPLLLKKLSKGLFHTFHFMHIVFATTGTILTYSRFSKNLFHAFLVGLVSPSFFCLLSDVVLPYIGARMLGVAAKMHICILEEPLRLLPFLCIGLFNGIVMAYYGDRRKWFHAMGSHAMHVFISAFASVFFLISQGFAHVDVQIGNLFLLLIVAVIIPCTFSDLIIPMLIAKGGAHYHEEH